MTQTKLDGWSINQRDTKIIDLMMPWWSLFYKYYFRVQTEGWENIPQEGAALLVGSHNGGLAAPDMFMFMYDWFRRFGPERPTYGLMHPAAWKVNPNLASIAVKMGALQAHPKMAVAALRSQAPVLVYPGGAQDIFRPYRQRHQICLAGRKGFIKLALRQEVPIIPLVSLGAHDTLIVLEDFYEQVKLLHQWGMPWLLNVDPEVFPLYLGLPWGLSFGPLPNFPLPSRIYTQVCSPILFSRYGSQAASDRDYVNQCYIQVKEQMQQELNQLVARHYN